MARSSSGASTARPADGASTTVREIDVPADVLRQLAARFPQRYPVLFDSAADGPLSRTSILVAEPRAALWLDSDGRVGAEGFTPRGAGFFEALENWWLSERLPAASAQTFPFNGGWALFLSYEAAQEIEPLLRLPRSSLPWTAFALRVPCALIHDRGSNKVFAVAESSASDALDSIEADARAIVASTPTEVHVQSVKEEDPSAYLGRVVRAKEYVRAGDIYQANLSRPWRVELTREPDIGALYNRLCKANPAPFAALAQWRGATILSSSPERLVRINDGHIDTRPIAGTRPRSRRPGDDIAEMTELAAHPKERAEHIMLIDLERNDLGRVSEAGTVRVDELMTIESYAHVHHIVSNVSGELRSDVTPIGALRAVFPGGTITGVPKFRCMQIIAELEGIGRGAYTGSLGFLGRDGSMDMNILIRTLSVQGRTVELRAGGGIVADSDPHRELEETRAKARGMLAAFGAVT
ncbi:MAG: aminodeoxychorismate synthase component I [Proteobacteria bacterium]|nr:aminodeoxychorismate synthase component I [Pseudomonadota bacterium]